MKKVYQIRFIEKNGSIYDWAFLKTTRRAANEEAKKIVANPSMEFRDYRIRVLYIEDHI